MKRKALLAFAGLLALVFFSMRLKGARVSHHDHNKEIARRFTEEPWVDPAVIDELVSPDFLAHDPAMPEPIHGIQGAKDFVALYKGAFPDARVAADELIGEGDRVVVRWTGCGTHEGELLGIAPSGRQVTVTGMSIYRLAGDKIVEEWSNWDTLGLLVQLGVAESPVSA
jgi:predicted ester cyclase